jgi:hypothetical protein
MALASRPIGISIRFEPQLPEESIGDSFRSFHGQFIIPAQEISVYGPNYKATFIRISERNLLGDSFDKFNCAYDQSGTLHTYTIRTEVC